MSILEKASQNLRNHGVDVQIPEIVEFHDRINYDSELFSRFGSEEILEAATYNSLNDRMDVYTPLAIDRAVQNLGEKDMSLVKDALDRNKENFSRELDRIAALNQESGPADKVIYSKILYIAAVNDEELDKILQDKLKNSFKKHALYDIEHEFVHVHQCQSILDGDFEPLRDDFERYFEDVIRINQDLTGYDERRQKEGISDFKDLKMAAAMNFLNEEELQNIVSLAGREHNKWVQKNDNISQEYQLKKDQVRSDLMENLEISGKKAFQRITSELEKVLGNDPLLFTESNIQNAIEFVEKLEEKGAEDYQTLRDAGIGKSELKETLSTLNELDQKSRDQRKKLKRYTHRTEDLLKDAIVREAELQGDFSSFLEQYTERIGKTGKIPRDFTEAYAQFWTAYREGDLEDDRESIFQRIENYEIDGLEDTMEDLLNKYDSLEGGQDERVTEIMSSQIQYLQNNYDLDIDF